MRFFKIAVSLLASLIFLNFYKILKNFRRQWEGRSVADILGVAAAEATEKDLEKLTDAELMQLFLAAPAPSLTSLQGEYRAKNAGTGAHRTVAEVITNHVFGFGTGDWIGKAFRPLDSNRGEGYNLFVTRDKSGQEVVERIKKMETYVGPSDLDGKDSYHLEYAPHNPLTFSPALSAHFMHDEVRQINEHLFVCMGYSTQQWASFLSPGGGTLNPAPFILIGPPAEWVGI